MTENTGITVSVNEYIISRFATAFNVSKMSSDKFRKSIDTEDSQKALQAFASEKTASSNHLICLQGSGIDTGVLSTDLPTPNLFKRKGVIALKLYPDEPITQKNILRNVMFVDVTKEVLKNLWGLFEEIYRPILHNNAGQNGPELVAKDLLEKFNSFLAQLHVTNGLIKGETQLPLPHPKLTESDATPEKDKAHIFEGSIITWTRQIKNILKLEPEQELKNGKDPNPLAELKFWENKKVNLDSIYQQLQREQVKKMLKFLEQNKSTYTNPFSKLQKEVQAARIEAVDNYKYLQTLKPYFENLVELTRDFPTIYELFIPIMHIILLIWKNSKYYNTPPRLVVLIREICNAIIAQARNYINGPGIFQMIVEGETKEACVKLQTVIDICTKFKDAYFEYKAKANGTWKLTTNALFIRLDTFLDRCHDILHLTNTIVQFSNLAKIEIGGTKGKTLTETVAEIYTLFQHSVDAFRAVDYDIMDITEKRFDGDFQTFRTKIKELERRLASVITQGFDDSDTMHGKFKVLDSFEGLLNRPIIQDELEKKHIILIDTYKQDLKTVQNIFLEGKGLCDRRDEKAPIYNNLPPIAGALTWCTSLLDRIKEPMDKLSSLSQAIVDREEFKDVQKLYSSIVKAIKEYEESKILNWEKEADESSKEKLKEFLLCRDENDLLKVNFDPALVRLLRETRYFMLLDLAVPQSASDIFAKAELYRTQICALDMIVYKYNNIKTCLHPVEEPLITDRIQKMDQVLKPALDELIWKSNTIDKFLENATPIVDSIDAIVQKMKGDIEKIKKGLDSLNVPLLDLKPKATPPDELDNVHKAWVIQKHQKIKAEGQVILKLVKEINDVIKIDKKSNQWRNYTDYVNDIVIQGITKAIMTSLEYLNNHLNFQYIKKHERPPIFDIKMELYNNDVRYEPDIPENEKGVSVRNFIYGWIRDFVLIASLISRIDTQGTGGDFLNEIKDSFDLREWLASVSTSLDYMEQQCNEFKEKFKAYAYLWNSNAKSSFEEFVADEVAKEVEAYNKMLTQAGDKKKDTGLEDNITVFSDDLVFFKSVSAKIPKLTLFDEKITELTQKQQIIQGIKTPHDIGWLRINVQPLKETLSIKISSWKNVYIEFLYNQLRTTIKNIKDFIHVTEVGIKKNPKEDENNKELLMSVMKCISDVRSVEKDYNRVFKRLKELTAVLKKHGVNMDQDYSTVIDQLSQQYHDTNERVFKVKTEIMALINQEAENIKKRAAQFAIQVQNFRNEFVNNLPYGYDDKIPLAQLISNYDKLSEYYTKLVKIEEEAKDYNTLEGLFELELSNYRQLRDCRSDLKSLKIMWDAISMVNYLYNDWKSKPWKSIKTDILIESNKNLANQIKNLPKEVKVFRGYAAITEKVKNMSTILPLIQSLNSDSMEKRHWNELQVITGKKIDHTSPTFCFDDILQLELYKYEQKVNEIVDKAGKEQKIERKLKIIDNNWNKQQFEFADEMDTKLLQPLDTMIEQYEADSLVLMGMMNQGKYVEHFKATVQDWIDKLKRVEAVVTVWLKVQKDWKRLVNIFLNSEDIKVQLTEVTKLFQGVDKDFRELMAESANNPSVIDSCTNDKKDTLSLMAATIEKCEKSLKEYLELKKKSFPRFYFVSDQALLDILSNGNNPKIVCKYLGECFDGLGALKFIKDATDSGKMSEAMIAKDGEEVKFAVPFIADGAVEKWLSDLEFKMRTTLADVLEMAKSTADEWEVAKPREEWIKDYCAQISLLATQIIWTEEVNKAFDDLEGGAEGAMKEYHRIVSGRIEALILKVRGQLSGEDRAKIITVITIDVHARDVVESFAKNKIVDKDAFAWQSQLKFFWEKNNEMSSKQALRFPWEKDKDKSKCIIRIVDWARFYSFEYVGNCGRLVITPLTDRCYITLTQALNLIMGGAPAGPAGTGKTETTKDLGRAIGLQVVVFNCSDQMTYLTLAQIFMGLSQSGAWGCFDEFNRISIEVLSVVSTQVGSVLTALKNKQPQFLFQEDTISLVDTVGFFITMNPGYAGRTELPENLKALFRSCAMVVPDLVLICENMLLSEGFNQAKELSKKFVTLYMLSRDLLSKQIHYDWGLRAVKSVLRQAGKLKRADPQIPEDPLLMRALRDFNLPKIISDDRGIFLRLIEDLFPKAECPPKVDADLKKLVVAATKEEGYIAEEMFCLKCVQLSEILEVRHCCFILGPPGSGKTTVWKTLAKSYTARGEDTAYDTVNPKAVSSDELFGAMTKSKEWKDGVLSNIMRDQSKNQNRYKVSHKWKWVILDGDVDPEWIESLNTVMDDNKVLTLVSNERVFLTPAMRLLFEVSNLRNATPATVSRGGVLFINDSDVGWKPYKESWIERSVEKKKIERDPDNLAFERSPEIDDIAKSIFMRSFDSYFENNADLNKVKHIAPVVDIMMIQTTCTILDCLLLEHGEYIKSLKEEDVDSKKMIYESFFTYAAMWAIGGSVGGDDDRDIKDFNTFWRATSKIKFPEGGLCFDYYFDPKTLQWQVWQSQVQTYVPSEEVVFSKIYVPTLHTTRLKALIDQHVRRKRAVLLIGPAGTGKTAVLKDYISKTNPEKIISAVFNFNNFTNSLAIQKNLESRVEKKTGKTYGLPGNKTLIYFIDDLNMPFVDKYGTQAPIALVRQLIDYESVYDRDHLEDKKTIQDVLFTACLNPKAGSFTVDLRLQRHFSVFTISTPTEDTIKTVYCSILGSHFVQFENQTFTKLSDKIIAATIRVFHLLLKDASFLPSARKFHYQFNLRELSKICEGIMQSTPSTYRGAPSRAIKLWLHECKRVFEDRFINEEDRTKFKVFLKDAYDKNLKEDDKEDAFAEPIVFTTFISQHYGNERGYLPIKDMPSLNKALEEKLQEHNESGKAVMNLVLFDQAMEHICRICRILDMPSGNPLLVGVGGSGKQSLAKLSAFILNMEVEQITVSQNYSIQNDFKPFLQELFKKCTKTGGGPRCFMMTDSQIQEEAYLVFINDMLSSGYVPDLFPKEELDGLVNGLRNEAKAAGIIDQGENLKNYFFDKLRRNLHVILCFSPVGEAMRIRARRFPGLISATSIDWFQDWPKDALISVASRFLADVEMPTPELRQAISLNMSEVHISIDDANRRFLLAERRYNYTTPKSFLELIEFYKKLLNEKRTFISNQIARLENGLLTLAETSSKVKGLQEDLKKTMVEVEKQSIETNALIDVVEKQSAEAEVQQQAANEEEAKTNVLAAEAEKIAKTAAEALEEALPAYIAAGKALENVKKEQITIMKNLTNPPGLLMIVAKAILTLLLNEKISANEDPMKIWKKTCVQMNDPQKFKDTLMNYDAKNIDEWKLEATKKIIADSDSNGFDFDFVSKKSKEAAYLGGWVTNTVKFNEIYKKVKPLDEEKRKAEETLAQKKKELEVVKEKVRILNEKVDGLRKQLAEARIAQKAVEDEAQSCRDKLDRAEKLVNGLAGENKRWGENVITYKREINTTIGDALLAACFVSYIGAFSASFRKDLWMNKWIPDIKTRQIPMTEGKEPLRILTDEATMAKWKNESLPADQMSLENAAIITSASRWPLMIDPQLQGWTWIKNHVVTNYGGLELISLSMNKWLNKLTTAISMGKAVMIENLGQEIDATLEPLLSRAIKTRAGSMFLTLGEEIEYDPKFKLYLQSKLVNPHYRPEVAAQCTIINFIVTESGLEDQLLGEVVKIERPDVETEKAELVRKQNEFQVLLAQLEANLLNDLGQADPNTILDNKDLIKSLDVTKKTAIDIALQNEKAKETEKILNVQREIYRKVAAEGSMLYFLIISLYFIDHMYQYSLEAFQAFFFKAINNTTTKDEERVNDLRKNIRFTIYQWVTRGLFERHRLIFLTLITFRLIQKRIIETVPYEPTHMHFLLQCSPKPGVIDSPLDWLPANAWGCIQRLIDIDEYRMLAQHMEKEAAPRFKDWYNELQPEEVKLPMEWKRLEGTFQKLLVIRCLRPDRMMMALTNFIRNVLPNGPEFIDLDQKGGFKAILQSALKDSTHEIPVFFILSAGADPVKYVGELAKAQGLEDGKNWFNIALGQGQDIVAMSKLELAHKDGGWVMLQNIHLMPKWLTELEKKLDEYKREGGAGNQNFRLFLSAEPSKEIPIGILDRSIKLTNEPPSGLKANMKTAWSYFPKEVIDDKDARMKAILFGLCFFHSTLIERRRFGPKGWNMFYPFNIGDLRDCCSVLNKYFEAGVGKIPWDDLSYIFGEIMYGGHIVDDWDRKLCNNYLKQFMHNELLDELELFPFCEGKAISFRCPPQTSNYDKYYEHIDTEVKAETPLAYGLHPNAEIGFKTTQCTILFNTLLELQPKDAGKSGEEGGGGGLRSKNDIVLEVYKTIMEDLDMKNKIFSIDEIKTRIDEATKGPYQNVFLQECEYMNYLIEEIVRSLDEVKQGFEGLLTISERMEQLIDAVALDRIPANWQKLAYPSKRGLGSWITNLVKRHEQLSNWKDEPNNIPKVTFISRFFNPQSFLTAIKQVIGKLKGWELNKIFIATEILRRNYDEMADQQAKEGAFIFGLVLEGARWDVQGGFLEESKPKEMFCLLPVVYARAGYDNTDGKEDKNLYYCPTYKTEDRGNTYVFTAQLRTKAPARKWILGGVALILDVESVSEEAAKKKEKEK